jgi:nitroimidazol reductase NimA-like FMN-containing flavoprotein (pyridoxamine 5'-phosphate oxidase superfamily)
MDAAAPLSPSPRTRLTRHKERAGTDRKELYAVLDAGAVCHLGVIMNGSDGSDGRGADDGTPVVLPTCYGRIGDTLYLHGSAANQSLGAAAGRPVCVTVTHLDGVVLARSVFHHSVNYRSAMIFGTARLVADDPERLRGLRAIVEQLAPGRWDAARTPTRKELAATAVLALPLAEASVKVRSGPPADDAEDRALAVWAGILPVRTVFGEPVPDPALAPGIAPPRMSAAELDHDRGPVTAPLAGQAGCP